ncbi:MAG: outer membrane protein transport protein [Myxococcales bacterium]|nr:outer membrane protein transport protein [Myxococcales bacterium]
MRRAAVFVVALIAALAPSLAPRHARAGGLEIGDTGATALGRGGAFVAKADSPTAINYNPAGFVKLRGHQGAISLSAVNWSYDYTPATSGGITPPSVAQQKPWFAAPLHLMLSTDFGVFERLTFAAGIYAPPTTPRSFPDRVDSAPAPQRYDLVSLGGVIFFPSLAVAFRVTDWLDIGVSFQWVMMKTTTRSVGTIGAACDQPLDPACDVDIEIGGADWFSPTGSIGALLRPNAHWEIGALLRLPAKATLRGKAKITFGPGVDRLENAIGKPLLDPENPDATVTNNFPLMVRLGARRIFRRGGREVADVELDVVYERWSAASERVITLEAQSLGALKEPDTIDFGLNDTVSLRLGGAYHFVLANHIELTLRAGAFGETASTNVSDTRLYIVGPKRLGLTAGLGLRWGRLTFDVAYAHFFMPKRVVEQSSVTARDMSGGVGPTIGNGTYSTRYQALAFQVGFAFGAPPGGATSTRPSSDDYPTGGMARRPPEPKTRTDAAAPTLPLRQVKPAAAIDDGLSFDAEPVDRADPDPPAKKVRPRARKVIKRRARRRARRRLRRRRRLSRAQRRRAYRRCRRRGGSRRRCARLR